MQLGQTVHNLIINSNANMFTLVDHYRQRNGMQGGCLMRTRPHFNIWMLIMQLGQPQPLRSNQNTAGYSHKAFLKR